VERRKGASEGWGAGDRFADRTHAGAVLAGSLSHLAAREGLVVLGLPRGGVPVATQVARALGAPLDVFVVRKLGVPGHEELAMGAVAGGGVRVLNDDVVEHLGIGPEVVEAVADREQVELTRREDAYRGSRPPLELAGRPVVLVDDGLATGATMRAAVVAARRLGAGPIVVAVPVGAPSTCADLARVADEVVCARTPPHFTAVGEWYERFEQTTDDEVRALLG
jgi:putative phosphoribosyl transferase